MVQAEHPWQVVKNGMAWTGREDDEREVGEVCKRKEREDCEMKLRAHYFAGGSGGASAYLHTQCTSACRA